MSIEYGIHGFCYYHYWFNGKRLWERPVDELASGEAAFSYFAVAFNQRHRSKDAFLRSLEIAGEGACELSHLLRSGQWHEQISLEG